MRSMRPFSFESATASFVFLIADDFERRALGSTSSHSRASFARRLRSSRRRGSSTYANRGRNGSAALDGPDPRLRSPFAPFSSLQSSFINVCNSSPRRGRPGRRRFSKLSHRAIASERTNGSGLVGENPGAAPGFFVTMSGAWPSGTVRSASGEIRSR